MGQLELELQCSSTLAGFDEVLDPNDVPNTAEKKELLLEKQKYMFAVFEKTLLTDNEQSLVHTSYKTSHAQQIYKELQEYALLSTKASLDSSSLLSYITTSKLGD